MSPLSRLTPFVLLVPLFIACKDPTADKTKAVVGEAKPTSAESAVAKNAEQVPLDATSAVGFTGSKVTGKHDGSFSKVSGRIALVDGKPEGSSIKVDVDTTSVTTDTEKLTGHLKSPDFFDTAKYPTATFESTEIKKAPEGGDKYTVTGNLDLTA